MKKLKWPLIIFGSFLLIILTLSIYAYKKLGPEEIKQITREKLEKEFPGARVGLGSLSLNFGLVSKVNLDNLQLDLREKKSKLFSIKKVSAKIPFWSMLFGLGSIDILLIAPEINYFEYKNTSNWKLAKGKVVAPAEKSVEKKEISKPSSTGLLLQNLRVNLKVKNLLSNYRLYKGEKGIVKVSKFEIFNFNFKGPAKFNLETELNLGKYSLRLKKEGQLNLAKKEFKAKSWIKNLKIPRLKLSQFEYETFFFWGQGKIKGSIVSDLKKAGNLKMKIEKEGDNLSLNNLTGKLNLGELIEKSKELDFRESILNFSGRVEISKKGMKPFIDIGPSKGPKIKFQKGEITSSFNAKIRASKITGTLKAFLLGGHLTSNLSGRINFKKLDNLNAQGPFNLNVILENLKIDPGLVAKKEKSKKGGNGKGKKIKEGKAIGIPRGKSTFRWKNISFGEEKLDGMAIVKTFPGKVDVSKLNFSLGKAKGNLKLKANRNKLAQSVNIDFSVKDLNLKQFEPFFPEGINVVTGRMNSKVKGWIKVDKLGKYSSDLGFDANVRNGKIKDFKLETHLRKIFSKTPFLTHLNKKNVGQWVTGDFDKLLVVGRQKSEILNLNNFHMVGIKKKIEIKGKGKLAEKGRSEVLLDFIDHKRVISGSIEKYTGSKALPLKFVGKGYKLKPKYEYSVETLLKRSVNFQTKKATKKLKKSLDKKLKKLFKF